MKRYVLSTFLILLFGCQLIGQPPQKMSYQAVLRDADDKLLVQQNVGVKISILKGDAQGQAVFVETFDAMTNINGLVSLIIGEGNAEEGKMENINWAVGPYYLKVETDTEGGTNYNISGTSQLISVPYALYANSAGGGDGDWVEDNVNNLIHTDKNIAVLSGGSDVFNVNLTAGAGMPRVSAGTQNGIGLLGNTDIGYGVRGHANQGVGVHGQALNFGVGVLGEGKNGTGVHGKSEGDAGVTGESMLNPGVKGSSESGSGVFGTSDTEYGVFGSSNGIKQAGVFGDGKNKSYGVMGVSNAPRLAGVYGLSKVTDGVKGESEAFNGVFGITTFEINGENFRPGEVGEGTAIKAGVSGSAPKAYGVTGHSEKISGVLGFSRESNGVVGTTKSDSLDKAGVYGVAEYAHGVYGWSEKAIGVFARSSAPEPDITTPTKAPIFLNKNKAGVLSLAPSAFGVVGQSTSNAGVFGNSINSNGVTGFSKAGSDDFGGVLGLAQTASGVYGWSTSGPGVKGKSDSGNAGEFLGELHIKNDAKNAKLNIESMEDDNTAPCLVWSGDKYVRKRECWVIEEDGETSYFVSNKGIKIKNGENTVFQVNPDGSSVHLGLESFQAGIVIPTSDNKAVWITPELGIAIYDHAKEEYLWHANLTGNSFAKESFQTKSLSAKTINAEVITANTKEFKIDHPLDPENKSLIHTSIESDERLNLYTGNVTTDSEGYASVVLPDWFTALNKDFRYQLTPIGQFAQLIIREELSDGVFKIQSDKANVKVSWQISGVRHDKWALEHPNLVEVDKGEH